MARQSGSGRLTEDEKSAALIEQLGIAAGSHPALTKGREGFRLGAPSRHTLLGCIPWVLMLALIGEAVGDNWEDWRHRLGYLEYLVLAAIVTGVVYLVVKRRRGAGPASPPPKGSAASQPD
jgi:hypothetical protein